ncbi:MAG: DUF2165 family protein [Devosiaceae bacterium]|nr:DUF2165 family protein [Devosiaceae bacterium MH13]
MELFELVAQCALVGLLAGWLVIGAYENIRSPSVNLDLVRDVFSMETMEIDEPGVFEQVKRNRITSQRVQTVAFRAVVFFETLVACALVIATLLLALAVLGAVSVPYAQVFAAWSVLGFTMIWGLFLVGGNWFHYWVVHQSSQHTHYFMTLWGIATLLVLL